MRIVIRRNTHICEMMRKDGTTMISRKISLIKTKEYAFAVDKRYR